MQSTCNVLQQSLIFIKQTHVSDSLCSMRRILHKNEIRILESTKLKRQIGYKTWKKLYSVLVEYKRSIRRLIKYLEEQDYQKLEYEKEIFNQNKQNLCDTIIHMIKSTSST